MAGKQDDYGYFGKGIDGYVHYKQAFDRNFSQSGRALLSSTPHRNTSANSSTTSHNIQQNSTDTLPDKDVPTQLDDSMMYSECFYYPPAQQQNSQRNPPSKGESDKDSARSMFGTIISFILIWIGAMSLIMGIPYLLGLLLIGSAGGADSFGGILILVVGVILIFLL
jgi:hypothetical protein